MRIGIGPLPIYSVNFSSKRRTVENDAFPPMGSQVPQDSVSRRNSQPKRCRIVVEQISPSRKNFLMEKILSAYKLVRDLKCSFIVLLVNQEFRMHLRLSFVLIALTSVAGIPSAFAVEQKTLVVSEWGYTQKQSEEFLYAPFEKLCGCKVVVDTGNNADRLNKMRIRGGIDVMFITDAFTQQGIDAGVFAKIDPTKLPHLGEIYDIAKAPQGPDFGPAYVAGHYGIIYDASKVKQPITSWKDLWRPELKGMVAVPGFNTTTGPVTALIAGDRVGVDAFKDPDAAFKSLAELKPNIRKTYNTGSELVNLFSTGEVVAAAVQDFAAPAIHAAVPNAKWAPLSEGDYAIFNTLNIGAKSENQDLAYQFIDYKLSADVQRKFVAVGDSPVNKNVALSPEQVGDMVYGADEIGKLRRPDFKEILAHKADWEARWNNIFGQ
ncbi:ABC transporter substrate-binding protein [Rhizobium sp. 1399]|uniref:ABC transporter substrate-binding protein n=1 Tax=Rhizobium sp. 1399 TaxID=2817758 RepID=UPI002855F9B3|nr:ABC transporter substrate-binding protein [Rhizobium sp. 1399]MDR6665265.1 putative spermidine/putrescine transport system substrate-binding protein [Rhizobium sp. 1399]